jgi:hypothetical protein
VYGNIDGKDLRLRFPEDLRFTCEEVEVFMTHIGGYPGKYAPRIKAELLAHPPKLFITGTPISSRLFLIQKSVAFISIQELQANMVGIKSEHLCALRSIKTRSKTLK